MSRQFWDETLTWATSSGSTVNSANVETILFPNVTVPANYMQDGRVLRIRCQGQWTTTGSTPTLTFFLRWGGVAVTVIAKTAAITTVASTTAAVFDMEIIVQTRSNGSSGTLMGIGICTVYAGVAPTVASTTGSAATTPMTAGGVLAPAIATVDLTADTALSITVQPSTTALTVIGLNYVIEGLN